MAGHPSGQPLRASQALQGDEGFVSLMRRLERSRQCYDAVALQLPAELRAHVRPGPLADDSWSLLASHSSAAAKLRQCLPALQSHLSALGLFSGAIRVKVARPSATADASGDPHRNGSATRQLPHSPR